jgi:hypothetical protein
MSEEQEAKIREVTCHFDQRTKLARSVVQHFGKVFRRMNNRHRIGEVFEFYLEHKRQPARSIGEAGISPMKFRLLAESHHNTVRAALRKAGRSDVRLEPGGVWYEVICD